MDASRPYLIYSYVADGRETSAPGIIFQILTITFYLELSRGSEIFRSRRLLSQTYKTYLRQAKSNDSSKQDGYFRFTLQRLHFFSARASSHRLTG
jgi:hypothetical protein